MSDESRRILVVDDDDAIRAMVERVLRREQFIVDTARDGYEAIEKLARHDYAGILLDLMMPRIDGLGVLEYVEQHRPELESAVIVMTANIPVGSDVFRAGKVCRVLAKPFDIRELIQEVRDCSAARAG